LRYERRRKQCVGSEPPLAERRIPSSAASELATQGIRAIQIALPRGIVGTVDGVEVLVLDVLDSGVRQCELVDHHAHVIPQAD
jgi:hypothetical protein